MLTTLYFLQFQIDHYTERLADARNDKEKSFLRKELYNIKQALKKF